MVVGNTEVLYHIDYLQSKVHILDIEREGRSKLADEISLQWQEELIDQQHLLKSVLDFDWICYLQDGLIARFDELHFKFLNPKLPYLYRPYVEIIMRKREMK